MNFLRRKLRKRNAVQERSTQADLSSNEKHIILFKDLIQNYGLKDAMELAVGGEFEAIGRLEVATLRHFGLKDDGYLIDVGCGSGRLSITILRR